tara:strand:- start:362 stop:871 length:510 start_codon:yes stop_codon:yes gene_type:complete
VNDQFISVGTAVITVSDTRSRETDSSGNYAQATLENMGHRVLHRRIIEDDVAAIQSEIEFCQQNNDIFIVILTGGTGITRRDVTPDAVRSLATKHIPGFGELFRMLSYSDIGSSTVQSRADAWLCDTVIVFALPGSTGAVKLAFDKILVEQLDARTRPCNFIRLRDRIV